MMGYCFLLLVIFNAFANSMNYFPTVEMIIVSPSNGSLAGPILEVSFRFDFMDEKNLRVNPSHYEYSLDVVENGLSKASSMPLSEWSIYYETDRHGWLTLEFLVTIKSNQSNEYVHTQVISQKVDVYVLPSQYSTENTHFFPDLNRLYSIEDSMLYDIMSSLSSYYGVSATTVAIAIDSRSVAFETVLRLSPMVIEVFDWSMVSDGTNCIPSPNIKFAVRHFDWHNVYCEDDAVSYRAFYDVTLVYFNSSDGITSEKLHAMAEFIYAMSQKALGHLVIMTSDNLLMALIDHIHHEYQETYLLNPSQRFIFMGTSGEQMVVAVYIKPVEKRISKSEVPPPDKQLLVSQWKFIENQRMSYLAINNGCIQENGELVILTSPDDFEYMSEEQKSLHDLLKGDIFLPFGDFQIGSVTTNTDVLRYINASAALIRPYFNFHVAHHFQSISGLLTLRDAVRGFAGEDPLSYLLLPKFDSAAHKLYDWTTGVLSLVTQTYEEQRSGSSSSLDKLTMLFAPQIHSLFHQHDYSTEEDNFQNSQLVCFKELIVLGQANTFTGLFANSTTLESFRQRAYNSYAPAAAVSQQVEKAPVTATADGGGDFYGLSIHKKNQYKLKVSFVLRWYNRRIVNLSALHKVLIESEMVDVAWLQSHNNSRWRYLEQMSLQEQIQLFKETDLLIGAHGGAFANAALFMEPNSVMIEIMPSRFSDPSFRQMAHQARLVLHTMFVTNHNQSSNCGTFAPECLEGSLEVGAGMSCFGLRNCDVIVDVAWFQALVEWSAFHVRANKKTEYWSL